ncbi:MAG: hydroxyacid dehydrogenase [Chloroflexota bacterium]
MKILIASSIYPAAIEKLREKHEVICAFRAPEDVLKEKIVGCDVLIFRSGVQITAEVMACAPDLKLLLRAGSGIDNLDLDYVARHNLKLIRVPEPGAKAVAEITFAFILATARNLIEADAEWRKGNWLKRELTAKGYLIQGKRLGVVGAGNIGSLVADMGVALGMDVIGCVQFPTPERAAALAERGLRLTDYHEVVSTSDFVSLHIPLNDQTRNLFNADEFTKMKQGAYLINLARGGVVNEEDLRDALLSGHLRGAALDVHSNEKQGAISPLADLPNVILTPHIGAGTVDSQAEIGDRVLQAVADLEAALA